MAVEVEIYTTECFLRNSDICNSFPTLVIEMSRNDILLSSSSSKVNLMLR